MDTQLIIETVQNIFIGADEKNWELCRSSFADIVCVDYTSLAGGVPAETRSEDVIAAWQEFLPKFHTTHHQLGNFTVRQTGDFATISFYGTATHFLPNDSGNNVWTVVGTYDASLRRSGNGWKVATMKFNFKYQDGNLNLPALARTR